jgi:hypothetical protein
MERGVIHRAMDVASGLHSLARKRASRGSDE